MIWYGTMKHDMSFDIELLQFKYCAMVIMLAERPWQFKTEKSNKHVKCDMTWYDVKDMTWWDIRYA